MWIIGSQKITKQTKWSTSYLAMSIGKTLDTGNLGTKVFPGRTIAFQSMLSRQPGWKERASDSERSHETMESTVRLAMESTAILLYASSIFAFVNQPGVQHPTSIGSALR